jgi:hypothetical protein
MNVKIYYPFSFLGQIVMNISYAANALRDFSPVDY